MAALNSFFNVLLCRKLVWPISGLLFTFYNKKPYTAVSTNSLQCIISLHDRVKTVTGEGASINQRRHSGTSSPISEEPYNRNRKTLPIKFKQCWL